MTKDRSKLVWTSDPDAAKRLRHSGKHEPGRDVEPARQTIRVTVDRQRRAGKTVTVATGFQHSEESLAALATHLKKRAGAGGTARGTEIEIQGDHVDLVTAELTRLGYKTRT